MENGSNKNKYICKYKGKKLNKIKKRKKQREGKKKKEPDMTREPLPNLKLMSVPLFSVSSTGSKEKMRAARIK